MWATRSSTALSGLSRLSRQCARCQQASRPVRRTRLVASTSHIRSYSVTPDGPYKILDKTYTRDAHSNTPPSITSKIDQRLLHHPSHPLAILRGIIESHFSTHTALTPSSPVVSVWQNFDELGFPPDHPGRSLTDSYYLNKEYMLRTHTSAHEVETYKKGIDRWLVSADVYRRDEIDASHYPVFHQMEGTQVWPSDQWKDIAELNRELERELAACPLVIEDETRISTSNAYQPSHDPEVAREITQHLKHSLNSLVFRLFGSLQNQGEPLRVRWIEAFFPFTSPSYEVEVWWNGEWLELLGCGVVQQKTLDQAGQSDKAGWAFGLGLERIAMVLFNIPDIRLFWSKDERFLSQFKSGQITQFQSYSKYPPCYKDMSFWLPTGTLDLSSNASTAGTTVGAAGGKGRIFHENDYCEIVREVAGDLVENVTLIDDFVHPKSGRQSKCYRLNYRSMDRSLSNEEVNALQDKVLKRVVDEMGIEIR